jgi:hypothetical protein
MLAGVLLLATQAVVAADYSASLSASPKNYSGDCPTKINFNGKIQANRPGRVQYKFIRSDGANAPIHTIDFRRPGSRLVNTSWTLGKSFSGWQAIQILYPQQAHSNRAAFTIRCRGGSAAGGDPTGAGGQRMPDLQVRLSAPATAVAGTNIGNQVRLAVRNGGQAPAPGTDTAGNNGYMVDLMLSSDTNTPAGWATHSTSYHEDVLLTGGRVSNTKTLGPGQQKSYPVGAGIPANTPTGSYYLCAKVDPGKKVAESNENNNVTCRPIRIRGKDGQGQDPTGAGGQRRPDLIVQDLQLVKGCKIKVTIKNQGGPLPDSAYHMTQGAAVQMYNGAQPWGGLRLGGIDTAKKLKNPGSSVSHIWFPGAANLNLTPGTHSIKVIVDNNNAVVESNEGNNTRTERLTCREGAGGQPGTADTGPRKPDLVIKRFGLAKWGQCKPNSPVITFRATITNQGNAPSPATSGFAMIGVKDNHAGINWGNGVKLGAIPAGGSVTKDIKVMYLKPNPAHMTGAAPHPFQATADPGNKVDESNEGNNKSGIIQVGAPQGCPETGPAARATLRKPDLATAARPVRPLQVVYPTHSQNYRIVGDRLEITIRFNRAVSAATVNPGSFKVWTEKDPNAAGTLSYPNSTTVKWISTKTIGNLLRFDPDGFFKVMLDGTGGNAIKDTGGSPLDGDKNGSPGGDYSHNFTMIG